VISSLTEDQPPKEDGDRFCVLHGHWGNICRAPGKLRCILMTDRIGTGEFNISRR
jgi:hypothetical protein